MYLVEGEERRAGGETLKEITSFFFGGKNLYYTAAAALPLPYPTSKGSGPGAFIIAAVLYYETK